MKTRAYWCARPFKDNKRFPYGFSRCGIFSLNESQLLENKGSLFQALVAEQVFDPSAEDLAFAQAMKRGNFEFSRETQLWAKYLYHQRRLILMSGGWKQLSGKTNSANYFTAKACSSTVDNEMDTAELQEICARHNNAVGGDWLTAN